MFFKILKNKTCSKKVKEIEQLCELYNNMYRTTRIKETLKEIILACLKSSSIFVIVVGHKKSMKLIAVFA